MLWVLLIVVIVVILVIKNKSQNNFKFQPPAVPGRTLDPNNVEDACFSLACLAASISDSFVSVSVTSKLISVSAGLDINPSRLSSTPPVLPVDVLKSYHLPADVADCLGKMALTNKSAKDAGMTVLESEYHLASGDEKNIHGISASLEKALKAGYSASFFVKRNVGEPHLELQRTTGQSDIVFFRVT